MSKRQYHSLKMSWYCMECGDEQEPYFIERTPKWDDHEGDMEWGLCPAHGDSNRLRQRVKLHKEHIKYVPKSWVIRWKAEGEFDWSELGDEECVEVTA